MGETASPRLGPRHRADTSVRASGRSAPASDGDGPSAWETRECPRPTLGVPLLASPAARRTAAAAAVVAFLGPLALTLCAPAAPGNVVSQAAAAPPAGPPSPDRAELIRADRGHRPTSLYPDGWPAPAAPPPPVSSTPAARPAPASTPASTTSTPPPRRTTTTTTSSTPRKRTAEAAPVGQAPAATGDVAAVLAYARAQVGKPYVYGAAGPNAFDCSGLVMAAYARIGIRLPHQASGMFGVGRPVARGDIRPGDVLVLEGGGHTAIALGGGLMIHASKPGRPVAIVKIYANPNAVRRLVG